MNNRPMVAANLTRILAVTMHQKEITTTIRDTTETIREKDKEVTIVVEIKDTEEAVSAAAKSTRDTTMTKKI